MNSQPNTIYFIPANCPNCGGELRVPNNRDVVKCMYCGHDVIIYDPNKLKVESYIDVNKIISLARVALEAKNYSEAYKYFSQIVEQEPENTEAWLGRGYSAGMMSTIHHSRMEEAEEYIWKMGMPDLYKKNKNENIHDMQNPIPEKYIEMAAHYLCELGDYIGEIFSDTVSRGIEYLGDTADLLEQAFSAHCESYYLFGMLPETNKWRDIWMDLNKRRIVPELNLILQGMNLRRAHNPTVDEAWKQQLSGRKLILSFYGLGDDKECLDVINKYSTIQSTTKKKWWQR